MRRSGHVSWLFFGVKKWFMVHGTSFLLENYHGLPADSLDILVSRNKTQLDLRSFWPRVLLFAIVA